MTFHIPGKKLLFLIIILSLIDPIHYLLLTNFHTEGYVFNGYCGDDCILMNIMKSWAWGLDAPWLTSSDSSIMNIVGIGPFYILLPLGYIALNLSINILLLFEIFKFISAVLLFLAAYNVFLCLSRKEATRMFLFFSLVAGLGGLIYVAAFPFDTDFLLKPDVLWGIGFNPMRTIAGYYSFPMALGLISLMFNLKGKRKLSYLFSGITTLLYPIYGMAFLITNLIFISQNKDSLRNILRICIANFIFLLPWLYSIAVNSFSFREFGEFVSSSNIVLPTFVLSFGLPLAVACIYAYKKTLLSWKIKVAALSVFAVSILSYSAASLIQSRYYVSSFSLSNDILFVMKLPLFIAVFAIFLFYAKTSRVKSSKNRSPVAAEKFVVSWSLLFLALTLIPSEILPFSSRLQSILWIPLSAIAIIGLNYITNLQRNKIPLRSQRTKFSAEMDKKRILIIFIILSVPSHIVYSLFVQNNARDYSENSIFYSTAEEKEALAFLLREKDGPVLAAPGSSMLIPLYSNKRSMIAAENYGFSEDWKAQVQDFRLFFSDSSKDEKTAILKKYNISYVYVGPRELQYGNASLEFLERIYQNDRVTIYKFDVTSYR